MQLSARVMAATLVVVLVPAGIAVAQTEPAQPVSVRGSSYELDAYYAQDDDAASASDKSATATPARNWPTCSTPRLTSCAATKVGSPSPAASRSCRRSSRS